MMIRTLLCLLAVMTGPVTAQTARVTAGEHDGFSRLVVELPTPSDWQLGRTAAGYALAVTSPLEGYDLAGVFDRIQRARLASVSVDPATGQLLVGLACACHAIPFEFRPGVIVIDLRDGPPPEGSSFEEPLAKAAGPEIASAAVVDLAAATSAPTPAATVTIPAAPDPTPEKPSRWVLAALPAKDAEPIAPPENNFRPRGWFAPDTAAPTAAEAHAPQSPRQFSPPTGPMAALRDDLLLQISRGAARGVVDIPAPEARTADPIANPADQPFAQVAINPLPGLNSSTVDDQALSLTALGATCIADARLELAAWERPGPVASEIAVMSSGVVGEFDIVNADALSEAIRYALFLGFGLEAAHLVDVFPTPEIADEAPVWTSLGRLIDGYPDPEGAFVGMQVCDSAAALWAVLSVEDLQVSDKINTRAIQRSFSALPLHLRLAVGPALADRFLQLGRGDIVQAIRDAIERAPEGNGATADLIGAKLLLAEGEPLEAEVIAKGIIDGAGPIVPAAMLALVEASLAQGKPIDAPTTDALRALLRESRGAPLEQALVRALTLAMASNGEADAAYALLDGQPQIGPEFWSVLATLGTDNDLLLHAVLARSQPLPKTSDATRVKIAARLVEFGFADAGLQWLGSASLDGDEDSALLFARATLLQNNPDGALDRLAARSDPPARTLAAEATLQLGDGKAAALIYQDPQDPAGQQNASITARDWAGLATIGSDPWKSAAALAAPPAEPIALTPLAEAAALLTDADATRLSVDELLASVPAPVFVAASQSP